MRWGELILALMFIALMIYEVNYWLWWRPYWGHHYQKVNVFAVPRRRCC
jgi:hypothetical protein